MDVIQTWEIRALEKAKELETSLLELSIILSEHNCKSIADMTQNARKITEGLEQLIKEPNHL